MTTKQSSMIKPAQSKQTLVGSDECDEFDLKAQILARQRMVGIHFDCSVAHLNYAHRNRAAILSLHLKLLTDLNVDLWRNAVARHINEPLLLMRAVGFIGRNMSGRAAADFHTVHGLFETGEQLVGTQGKFKRFAAGRRIKHRTILKLSGVMNADGIALLGLCHVVPLHVYVNEPPPIERCSW